MNVRFVAPDGSVVDAEAAIGERLLEVGQRIGMSLEGTCEGQMACATCHVIIAPEHFDRLPPATEEEEDMLDFAYGTSRTSRLACQIVLGATLDGLIVRVPGYGT